MPKPAVGPTDGSQLAGGLNPSGGVTALQVDNSGNLKTTSAGGAGSVVNVADPNTPANKLAVNADGSINVNPSTSSSSTAINDGTTTTRKATVDAGGNLHTLDANTATITTNTGISATAAGTPGDAAYTSGSGSLVAILKGIFARLVPGQQTKSASLPVTIASDQGNIAANIAQWNGATPGQANPVYTSSSVPQGYTSAYASNPAATTANTDYSFAWGGAGNTPIRHMMIQNNSGANLQWDLDVASSAGSPILATGQTLFLDVTTTVLHLLTSGAINVNGTTAGNIVVRGWS